MIEDRDVEVDHEPTGFIAELRRLADALESGEAFTIHIDGEDLTIPEGARLSVAHEREGSEVELEFQVTWSLEEADDAEEDEDEDEDDEEEEVDENEEDTEEGDKEEGDKEEKAEAVTQ